MQDVAVIGAGASGLVCARELRRAGLSATVFEASARIGGTWVYSDEVEDDPLGQAPSSPHHGSMYASLRTNLPRDLMAFRDYPFDSRGGGEDAWPRFIGHAEVRTYLERFTDAFGLRSCIRFGHRVNTLQRNDAGWWIRCAEPHGSRRWRFDAIAVCNGHYHRPWFPELQGLAGFEGRVMHSHNYRRPDSFRGRRVALLGAKASGIDLSGELAPLATAVFVSARDPAAVAKRPGIEVVPPIVGLHGRCVLLADGRSLDEVDDLLLCTGYRYHFPFLASDNPWIHIEPKWVHPLWLDLIAIRAPTLAFVGLPMQIVPFPQAEIQARLFAHLLTGRIVLPRRADMERDQARQVQRLQGAGIDRRHWLFHGPRQFAYYDALARRVGSPPLPTWFQPLYEACSRARRSDPSGYRDAALPIASG